MRPRFCGSSRDASRHVIHKRKLRFRFRAHDGTILGNADTVITVPAYKKGSLIYGMPILEAYKAKTITRQQALDARWQCRAVVFGDAKTMVEDLVKATD